MAVHMTSDSGFPEVQLLKQVSYEMNSVFQFSNELVWEWQWLQINAYWLIATDETA